MMISVSNINAYALQAPIAAAKYYNVEFSAGFVLPRGPTLNPSLCDDADVVTCFFVSFEVLLIISTQLTGIAYAGLTQRFLVRSALLQVRQRPC